MNARIAKKTLAGTPFGSSTGWSRWQVQHRDEAARTVLHRAKWHPSTRREFNRDRPGWLTAFYRRQADPKRDHYPTCSNCHHGTGPDCWIRKEPCPAAAARLAPKTSPNPKP